MSAGKASWLIGVLFIASFSFAQKNKTQLQKERQQNLQRIQETEKILDETSKEKKSSIGELTALNKRIEQQESLISSTKGEINLLDTDLREDNQIIDALEQDVTNLKEVMGVYEERAVKYGIPFLRYDSLDICLEGKYFKDNSHLNAKGAYLYSTIFANDILNKTAIYRP